MRRTFVAFCNPATRGDHARIAHLLRTQAPPEVTVDIRQLTRSAGVSGALGHAPITAFDAAIAVGGDGTVSAVAAALRNTGVPLGIIPTGSTNVIASDLRIPGNPLAATRLVFTSRRTVALDMGAGADSGFLHMAGAGLDSRMFAATSAPLKERIAWLAYVPAALRSLRRSVARFTLVVDGCLLEAESPMVLVANAGSLGRLCTLDRSISSNDGWLDLLVFKPNGPRAIASILGHLARQRLATSPYVLHRRARQISIAADPALPVQMDGDLRATTPVTFTISPGAIRAIVGDT